jgi:hypothetical protein
MTRRREQRVDAGGQAAQGAAAAGPTDLDPSAALTLLRGGEAVDRADLPEVERHRIDRLDARPGRVPVDYDWIRDRVHGPPASSGKAGDPDLGSPARRSGYEFSAA